jgi:hypothetical protein
VGAAHRDPRGDAGVAVRDAGHHGAGHSVCHRGPVQVTWEQRAKKPAKAALHDPQRMGLAEHGFRQKVAEIFEKLPGRDS